MSVVLFPSNTTSNRSADWSGDDHSGKAHRPLRGPEVAVSGGKQETGTAGETAPNLFEQLARDALCSAEPEPSTLYDGLFYLALGAMAATVLGLLVLWCQS